MHVSVLRFIEFEFGGLSYLPELQDAAISLTGTCLHSKFHCNPHYMLLQTSHEPVMFEISARVMWKDIPERLSVQYISSKSFSLFQHASHCTDQKTIKKQNANSAIIAFFFINEFLIFSQVSIYIVVNSSSSFRRRYFGSSSSSACSTHSFCMLMSMKWRCFLFPLQVDVFLRHVKPGSPDSIATWHMWIWFLVQKPYLTNINIAFWACPAPALLSAQASVTVCCCHVSCLSESRCPWANVLYFHPHRVRLQTNKSGTRPLWILVVVQISHQMKNISVCLKMHNNSATVFFSFLIWTVIKELPTSENV